MKTYKYNTSTPSETGMQTHANFTGSQLEELNMKDMKMIRKNLLDLNTIRGLPRATPLTVQGDGRYNNPLGSGTGKTLFQPATQAVYTLVENMTPAKQIIGINCKNKLCRVGERLRNMGENIVCPDHEGHCSANISMDNTIGDERTCAIECAADIVGPHVPVSEQLTFSGVVTDGDSRAYDGIRWAQGDRSNVKMEHFRDTRHLSNSQRLMIKRACFI